MEDILKKYINMQNFAKKCAYYYYNDIFSIIDDAQYDQLIIDILAIEKEYPNIKISDSITEAVGFLPDNPNYTHSKPMLSLDNVFSTEELIKFYNRMIKNSGEKNIQFCAEEKIDGLSLSIKYKNRILESAATRGNGIIGENVTDNVLAIKSIPKIISLDGVVEIRGEIFIYLEDFKNINLDKQFSNARNYASGSLRQLDNKVTASRNLSFIAYNIIGNESLTKQSEILLMLSKIGFITPDYQLCDTVDSMLDFYKNKDIKRQELKYEIDGVVYKIDDISIQNRIGYNSRSPKFAVAHKFASESVSTKLIDVSIQVGRTGVITPVAILEKTEINGSTISKATLHNFDDIKKKDIFINDIVELKKAGDVIPYISGVAKKSEIRIPILIPEQCPCCKCNIYMKNNTFYCLNGFKCLDQFIASVVHFVSREAMDIDGLGKKHIDNFCKLGIIKKISDIFNLNEIAILQLNGWGGRALENLINSINSKTTVKLENFIYAIGIDNVGQHLSKNLAKNYKNFNNLFNAAKSKNIDKIEGIGDNIIFAIYDFFENKFDSYSDLLQILNILDYSDNTTETAITGKKIVFTGTLETFTRNEAKTIAENAGAIVCGDISKNVDILIIGKNPGSKSKKAIDLGITIITENDFKNIVNTNK